MAKRRVGAKMFAAEVEAAVARATAPKATLDFLRTFALRKIAEVETHNQRAMGRDIPEPKITVDGRLDPRLRSLGHNSTVVAQFDFLDKVLKAIGDWLIMNSPVGQASDPRPGHPGMYRESHALIADNVFVPPGVTLPAAEEYFFVSTAPYARKIERGLSDQAPGGVYEMGAGWASTEFRDIADIWFGYRAVEFGAIAQWAQYTGMESPGRRGEDRDEWLRAQPAIIVRPK